CTRVTDFKRYWAGAGESSAAKAVNSFLLEFSEVCTGISSCLKPGGTAILIVGRRTTGGYRVKLDDFVSDKLGEAGLEPLQTYRRRLRNKRMPKTINRYARCASTVQRRQGHVRTMSEEIILAFRKPIT